MNWNKFLPCILLTTVLRHAPVKEDKQIMLNRNLMPDR